MTISCVHGSLSVWYAGEDINSGKQVKSQHGLSSLLFFCASHKPIWFPKKRLVHTRKHRQAFRHRGRHV